MGFYATKSNEYAVSFLISNYFFTVGNHVFEEEIGIPMEGVHVFFLA